MQTSPDTNKEWHSDFPLDFGRLTQEFVKLAVRHGMGMVGALLVKYGLSTPEAFEGWQATYLPQVVGLAMMGAAFLLSFLRKVRAQGVEYAMLQTSRVRTDGVAVEPRDVHRMLRSHRPGLLRKLLNAVMVLAIALPAAGCYATRDDVQNHLLMMSRAREAANGVRREVDRFRALDPPAMPKDVAVRLVTASIIALESLDKITLAIENSKVAEKNGDLTLALTVEAKAAIEDGARSLSAAVTGYSISGTPESVRQVDVHLAALQPLAEKLTKFAQATKVSRKAIIVRSSDVAWFERSLTAERKLAASTLAEVKKEQEIWATQQ